MIKEGSLFLDKIKEQFDVRSEVRQQAWDILQQTGLPNKKSESYKYTPITSLLEKKVDFELDRTEQFDESNFYKTEGSHLVIKNGFLDLNDSIIDSNIDVESKEVSSGKHDPLSLLNTVLSPEEINLKVYQNTTPIFIYLLNTIPFSNPRIKVLVEKNQELTIVEKSFNSPGSFTNSYTDFSISENAKVNYSKVQVHNSDSRSHETVFSNLARDSRLFVNTFTFSGGTIRNNVSININDENCEGHLNGLYLMDGKSHVDNNTTVDHLAPNSYSSELYKGILDEKSTGIFNGKIYVRQEAQKTNAFQTNNNILLSDEATVNTKPQLEIWADDVKCSHGCTSGQLDEEAIFYLRSRGISEKNAKAMILNAFAQETLFHVVVEELKAELEELITKKLL